MSEYSYTKTPVALDRLTKEIQDSAIITALDHITLSGTSLSIFFKATLSSGDESILSGIVSAHTGEPLPQNEVSNVTIVGNSANPKDSDGVDLYRLKITKTGWTLQVLNCELSTATTGGAYCHDETGASLNYFTYTMYDTNGAVTTTQADATKTIVDIECPYDLELIKGAIRQKVRPTTDIYCHIIIVPDFTYGQGGSRAIVRSLDLSFISPDDSMEIDGKSPKLLTYNATYHTNKIRCVMMHDAGVQHKIQLSLEYYRA